MRRLASTFENVSISHDTHRDDDLITHFVGFIMEFHAQAWAYLVKEGEYQRYQDGDMSDNDVYWFINEELDDILNEIAPTTCYFGAHPGNGSDFGFWIIPNY